ncbi:hypothetical protein CIB48_g3306 [Xylaria polymorpha]|nr:hypothetical protein CIB48_g3306 [Xylaria polymorpha]
MEGQTDLLPASYYQYQSDNSNDLQSDFSTSRALKAPAADLNKASLPWRPFYLRRVVLLGFIILFILIIVAIESLVAISNKNNGIATSMSNEHYPWTYGPTAFLTAVAAVCGLISLRSTNVAQNSYPLVLKSQFVDSSAKLTTTGNLAWFIMAGLGSHNLTFPEGISSEYAFQPLQINFSDTVLETRATAEGLRGSLQCDAVELNLAGSQLPNETDITATFNVTISAPGCNVAFANLRGVYPKTEGLMTYNSELLARFEQVQCDEVKGDDGKRLLVLFGNLTYYTDSFVTSGWAGVYGVPTVLNRSTQLLCVPTYAIEKIEVIYNETHMKSVMPVQGVSSRLLGSVSAWDLMDALFVAGMDTVTPPPISISMVPVDTDDYMGTALSYFLPPGLQATTLFDPTILQNTAEAYYRQMTAIISRQSLMEPALDNVLGSATISEKRLIIRPLVSQTMVGFLAVCTLFTAVAFFIVSVDGFLPHNPSGLLCSISLFLHSRDLLARLRYSGESDNDYLARWLGSSTFRSGLAYDIVSGHDQFCIHVDTKDGDQSAKSRPFPQTSSKTYHPIILHPASRLILCLCTLGLIVALELLLRKSNIEDGLGDTNDEHNRYTHYTWTAIPALVFGALSIAYSAIDFQIRMLAPYTSLKRYIPKEVFAQLDLLDMAIPMAIYKEVKLRNPWGFATTTAVLFASLFTTLSASLFQELSISNATSILLQANQSFLLTHDPYKDVSPEIFSLILESNFSFPSFTFNDLAFPQFVAASETPRSNTYLNASAVSISTVIPAIRGRMDCRSYEPAYIHTNLTLDYITYGFVHNPLDIFVVGEDCGDPDRDARLPNARFETYANTTYFGTVASGFGYAMSCSDLLYVWGKIDYGANPIVQHVDAIGCNMTFEVVDVNTTFIGTDLNIDLEHPPQPLNGTTRSVAIPKSDYLSLIETIPTVETTLLAEIDVNPQSLDMFFAAIVTSPWAIPVSNLGDPDPSTRASVIAAIKFHHGIITAQLLRSTLAPANTTNSTLAEPIGPGDNDAQPHYNATVTDPTGRRRVVQDAVSTHVLAALLATTLVLFIIGWAGTTGTDVLPRSPTTIASSAALIAGGNVLAHVPADAQSLEDIIAALGGPRARLWMGWGNLPDEEGRLTGGENEAGVSQFGIFVVDEEEIDRSNSG